MCENLDLDLTVATVKFVAKCSSLPENPGPRGHINDHCRIIMFIVYIF